MESRSLDVMKASKAIEELKVELLKSQGQFMQGTLHALEKEILESLAGMVGVSYLLVRRLGFDFSRLDRVLYSKMSSWEKEDYLELESEWGDISLLLGYLAPEEN